MIYKDFSGIKLSALGMGTMRLPVINDNYSNIDKDAVNEMVDYAIDNGINYFDTAWGYHDGFSESAIGESLARFPRDKFFLATKFPGYDLSNMGKAEEIFEKQLKKCQVEYIDFYLFHNVCEMNIDAYLDTTNGVADYIIEQKRNGRIKHLGFSAHGSVEVMTRFLEKYGQYMEFCQIQLNWLDYDFQDAKAKVDLLKKYDLPIWVMEPLRGGKLAKLSDSYEEKLKMLRPDESIPAWAFRFLQTIPEVTVTLSGMSNFAQLKANIDIFSEERPLKDNEMSELLSIADELTRKTALPCTACRYCTTHCPMSLDIPRLLELYNEHAFTGGGFLAPMALMAIPKEKQPSSCIGCRSCEAVCPQEIKISEAMASFAKMLG